MRKLSTIKESIWGDLARRSGGTQVRAEDDVDNLDSEGLYEHLKNIYKEVDSFQSIKLHPTMNTISVPIFVKGFKPYRVFFEFDNEEIFIEYTMPYEITGFFSKLNRKFHLKQYDTKQGMPAKFYIFPKDGSDVTNRFFIEVIDFLIDCIPNPDDKCIERIVNESIWGDLARRSGGIQVRAENDINNLDGNDLYDYLKDGYSESFVKKFQIVYDEKDNTIEINDNTTGGFFADYDINIIYKMDGDRSIFIDVFNKHSEILANILSNKSFLVKEEEGIYDYRVLKSNGSDPDNNLFVELVDCMINS